jgi:hypothetical protein
MRRWGGASGAQNRKLRRPGSVSVWGVQISMVLVEEIRGEGIVW